jgi:hypothetical protein
MLENSAGRVGRFGHGMSDPYVTLSVMVRYDIAALLSRFDVRVEGETTLTGQLSTLLGEGLLLAVLGHYLRTVEGREIEVLDGKPHRDDAEFQDGREEVPRDLDAWLLLDEEQLAAVECKQWTSSSTYYGRGSVPATADARAAHAKRMWKMLVSGEFEPWKWTDVNKIALPLKPPDAVASRDTVGVRRILAVWAPVSEDGCSCMSSLPTMTLSAGQWVDIEAEVFSASLYLRDMLASGMTHLDAEDGDLEKMLSALSSVIEVTGLSLAGQLRTRVPAAVV